MCLPWHNLINKVKNSLSRDRAGKKIHLGFPTNPFLGIPPIFLSLISPLSFILILTHPLPPKHLAKVRIFINFKELLDMYQKQNGILRESRTVGIVWIAYAKY